MPLFLSKVPLSLSSRHMRYPCQRVHRSSSCRNKVFTARVRSDQSVVYRTYSEVDVAIVENVPYDS
jgi:hypothetical protein